MSRSSLEVIAHKRIAELRRERHLTPAEFAEQAGISRPYLSMIENGKATRLSAARATRIAEVLQVPRSDLFKVVA